VQLFAAEPQINKPINLAHDTRGRLWVSSTVEYPYAAARERWSDPQGTHVRDSRDAIKILEDTDGDGRADKVTDFADGLNIPTGVLPWHKPEHQDGCIAWSIPNIWYFADTTGDGKADHREVLFGPLGYERDTHGMCSSFRLGRDGWIYATHGFNNTSRLRAKDGTEIELHSGNVFRFKPDASAVEVWSRGQVNPFGLCFDRRGNLYSADCHSAPVYQLLQGGTYPSFGKPHDGLGFAPTMIEHSHGSTGICGISYIDRDQWGSGWNDHLLIGNPVTSRVNHDKIEFRGTTPVAVEQEDFIISDDPWFRPVDLCLGNDGALYVADFYNRIIGHYEVPLTHPGRDRERGRIWKITKKGATHPPGKVPEPPSIEDPIDALNDPDPFTVRGGAHDLQRRPQAGGLLPLLETLTNTQSEDTHLIHVLRLAIRSHLEKFPQEIRDDSRDSKFIPHLAAIAPAIHSASAAALLADSPNRAEHLSHIARFGTPETLHKLIASLRESGGAGDGLAQLDSLQAGLDERGQLEPDPELLAWAQAIATELLQKKNASPPSEWSELPHPDHPNSASPWTHQPRQCADGLEAKVLSSLRIGEGEVEQRTGRLHSAEFPTPATLTFWLVGHRGYPDRDPHEKNYISLITSDGSEIRRAYPPCSDTAEEVSWKFEPAQQGKPVRLQITDGDSGNAYA
ncbi:MAG: PVC-type heme-binding CxxCH protein, partial [Verrucomicrobiales bacterium]